MRRIIGFLAVFFIFISGSATGAAELEVKNVGIWPGFDNPRAIAVDNTRDIVFFGTGDVVGIYDLDMTYRGHIRLSTKSGIKGVAYDEDLKVLHVAGGEGGFVTIDVSDPANPKTTSTIKENSNNPGFVMGVEIKQINAYALKYTAGTGTTAGRKFVFLADKNFGMRVYDVTDPSLPFEYGFYRQDSPYESKTTGGYINVDSYYYGGKLYVFVLDSYYGLRIFDATNPGKILKPVSKDLRDFYYNSISVVKDLAVAVYSDKLYCFVAGPNTSSSQAAVVKYQIIINPAQTDTETTNVKEIKNIGRCDTLSMGRGLALHGNYAFVADNDKGVRIVDVVNSTGLTTSGLETYAIKTSISDNAAGTYSVFTIGSSLYFASLKQGLRVYDVSNPEVPSDTGLSPQSLINGKALDIAEFQVENTTLNKFENRIFSFMVSEGKAPALYIFDVTATDSVTLEAVQPLSSAPTGIKVSNDFSYISAGDGGLYIVYIGNPRLPGNPLRVDTQGFAYDLAVKDGYVYIADGTSGLAVVDARDPVNPSQPLSFSLPGYELKGIDIKDRYAYFASGDKGMVIGDISAPSSPVLPVSTVDTPGNAVAVHIDGNNAFIADGPSGLQIINITNPLQPGTPYQTSVNGFANDVFAAKNYAFVSRGANGYVVVDVENPSTSTVLINYASYGIASGIMVYNDLTHVADGSGINNISRFSVKNVTPPAPLNPTDPESACFIRLLRKDSASFFEKAANRIKTAFASIHVLIEN